MAIFWQTVLYGLMLPYQIYQIFKSQAKPGRPGSQPISKFFRKAFEGKRVKRLIGAGLMGLMVFLGVMENALAVKAQEADATLITTPQTEVITEKPWKNPLTGRSPKVFTVFTGELTF